eukprot:scaffold689_cov186-Amphora_coffeaeformis.AAC.14
MSSSLLALRRVALTLNRQLQINSKRHAPTAVRLFSASEQPIIPGIGAGKTSTGYFQLLLDTMAASDMPETAQYRIDVTKWANFVIKTVKENPNDPEAVEDAVQMGQVEELIEMADDEMIAMDAYLSVRMWELAEAANPHVNFNADPMEDEMAEGGNPNVQEAIRKGLDEMKKEKKE